MCVHSKEKKELITIFIMLLLCIFYITGCNNQKKEPDETPDIVTGIQPSLTPTETNPQTPGPSSDHVIDFTDPYLEAVIRENLNKSIGDIRMSDVQTITSLTARVKGIRNISDLSYFTSLESLDLYGNKIVDISVLGNLTNLKVLNIGKNYNALYSHDSSNGMNLNALSTLPLLEELYVTDNGITDISYLMGLTYLKKLDLSHNRIQDISALSDLTSLEMINISYNKITELDALSTCTNLNYIDASNNYYEVMSETNFYTGYGIKDISFVENLKELTYIDISMNMIKSVEALAKLTKISQIYANDNYITDINCFKSNKTINILSLKRNYIVNFDVILSMTELQQLEYEGNPIIQSTAIEKFEERNKIIN